MAALTQPARVSVRAAAVGEGAAIASLWRELWEAHERWGGYPGSPDPRVYAQLARRLDDDARVRAGYPTLGRHVHVVCDVGDAVCGQVEGWFEQHGIDLSTPYTCEVRSLVVAERARHRGAGRALLDALAVSARKLAGRGRCVLAAEVLDRNPAHAFYTRVGYSPVAWSARIEAEAGAPVRESSNQFAARLAIPRDALPLARLESLLAARRQACGDSRYDRPRRLDATFVAVIGAQLASESPASLREPATLVAVDASGTVRGAASFTVHSLEPPFLPVRRALVGRFAFDVACPPSALMVPLVAFACRLGLSRGATQVELTDLSPPGTALYDAAIAMGARAWSRVVTKIA
jgi:GNAT superfamily N-acetyltransferase